MNHGIITILCGGPGLGFYIPGLILRSWLNKAGIPAEVLVWESFLIDEKRNNIMETKRAFHQNFNVALMGQRIAKDVTPYLDNDRISLLFDLWQRESRSRFVIFSGFWTVLMERYIQTGIHPYPIVDCCHVDVVNSTSWALHQIDQACFRHIWFWNFEQKKILHYLPVNSEKPVPLEEREDRFMVHGGGWGMGNYRQILDILQNHHLALDIIMYEKNDITSQHPDNRYFLIDPEWQYWGTNPGRTYTFPPFGEYNGKDEPRYFDNGIYPEVYDHIRTAKAIISKPGGSTLVDSMSSATPVVFLAPFGEYERKNGLLWEELGFGISFERWRESGFSDDILRTLHQNLLHAREKTTSYAEDVICSLRQQ